MYHNHCQRRIAFKNWVSRYMYCTRNTANSREMFIVIWYVTTTTFIREFLVFYKKQKLWVVKTFLMYFCIDGLLQQRVRNLLFSDTAKISVRCLLVGTYVVGKWTCSKFLVSLRVNNTHIKTVVKHEKLVVTFVKT